MWCFLSPSSSICARVVKIAQSGRCVCEWAVVQAPYSALSSSSRSACTRLKTLSLCRSVACVSSSSFRLTQKMLHQDVPPDRLRTTHRRCWVKKERATLVRPSHPLSIPIEADWFFKTICVWQTWGRVCEWVSARPAVTLFLQLRGWLSEWEIRSACELATSRRKKKRSHSAAVLLFWGRICGAPFCRTPRTDLVSFGTCFATTFNYHADLIFYILIFLNWSLF
jgi:hypothetical protein